MRLVVSGSTPSKKNSRINTKSGRSFPSKRYTEWHDLAVIEMQQQFAGYRVTEYPITVRAVFYWKDRRRHDTDNSLSSILDTLKDAGVIEDDDFNHVSVACGQFGGIDKKNPRCEVYLDETFVF